MRTQRSAAAGRAGFTLIELLAVIVILGILSGLLYTAFGSSMKATEVRLTQTYLAQIEGAISAFESDEGDWPMSRFPASQAEGAGTNEGAEALVVALFSEGRNGFGLRAEWCNSDGDQARSSLTDFPTREIQELADKWENPIAYFHHADYGDEVVYVTYDPKTGERYETRAKALRDGDTGGWRGHLRFQLLSAGPDGMFGTDDDICNLR